MNLNLNVLVQLRANIAGDSHKLFSVLRAHEIHIHSQPHILYTVVNLCMIYEKAALVLPQLLAVHEIHRSYDFFFACNPAYMLCRYVAYLWWDALNGKIEPQIPKINHLDSLLLHLNRHGEKGILHAQHFRSPRNEERSKQEQAKYADKATKGRIVGLR